MSPAVGTAGAEADVGPVLWGFAYCLYYISRNKRVIIRFTKLSTNNFLYVVGDLCLVVDRIPVAKRPRILTH